MALNVQVNAADAEVKFLCQYINQDTSSEGETTQILNEMTVVAKGTVAVMEYLCNAVASDRLLERGDNQALVHQWISYIYAHIKPAAGDQSAQKSYGKFVADHLRDKTYLVGDSLTLADVVMYVYTHGYVAVTTDKRRLEFANFVRWFDLVQHRLSSINAVDYHIIDLQLDLANDENVDNHAADNSQAKKVKDSSPTTEKPKDGEAKRDSKKPDKEKKPKAVAPAELPVTHTGRLDIRVGLIKDVQQHENADSLYVEKIDLNEEHPRTVVSGLVKHIAKEDMLNRLVIVLCNLKPAAMRGIKSEGMVLCATGSDGKVELLTPPEGSKAGDKIVFTGFEDGTADAVLNPKKKVWETIQPLLFTDESKEACYKVSDTVTAKMISAVSKKVVCAPTAIRATIK